MRRDRSIPNANGWKAKRWRPRPERRRLVESRCSLKSSVGLWRRCTPILIERWIAFALFRLPEVARTLAVCSIWIPSNWGRSSELWPRARDWRHPSPAVVVSGEAYVRGANRLASERDVAKAAVEQAERAAAVARARHWEFSNRAPTLSALRGMVSRLRAFEVAALRAVLNAPERMLMHSLRRAVREIALGRPDVER